MWKWLLLAGASVAFAQDPPGTSEDPHSPDCPTSLAKLNAAQTSRATEKGKELFTVDVSEDRNSVFMFNRYPDESGRMRQTMVNFVRASDGLWHGNRVTLVDGKEVETKQWRQPSIPYTTKTIIEHRLENGPVTEQMIPPFARPLVNRFKIPLASIEQARRELKAEAFSKKPVVWYPAEGLMDAISLATVRLDPDQLLHAVLKGQAAFGYSNEKVIAQLEGREAFTDTSYDATTSAYGHVVGSLVLMNVQRPDQEAKKALDTILKSLRQN